MSTISQLKKEVYIEYIIYLRHVIKNITDMKTLNLLMLFILLTTSQVANATEENKEIPPVDTRWNNELDPDRTLFSSPSLFKDANHVYVYSEKQLDNLTIGITDMLGNVYHYEVTTILAGMYYAIPIESLPVGQYYFCIYQGSNYVIGIFSK